MRPTFRLRFKTHDLVASISPDIRPRSDSRRRSRTFGLLKSQDRILLDERESEPPASILNDRHPFMNSWKIEERKEVVRKLKVGLLKRCTFQTSLVDVSLYNYASPTTRVPVELVMVHKYTGSCSPLSSGSVRNPGRPQTSSYAVYKPRSVALTLYELGYDGGFYDLKTVRRKAKNDVDWTYPLPTTTRWPVFTPEEGEDPPVASLIITERRGHRLRFPVVLTLPSPAVLNRYSLLRRIFREPHAQGLLTSVWDWTRVQRLQQFTPTAIAIMTGSFLQRTQEPISDLSDTESFASFLRHWSNINQLHKDIIISVCDPEQPLQPPLTRQTSENSDYTVTTQSSFEQFQPMSWSSQALIIQDPYALTQNHAEGVSMKQLNRFAIACQDTLKRIGAGETPCPFPYAYIASEGMSTQTQDHSAPNAENYRVLVELLSAMDRSQNDPKPSPVSVEISESNVSPVSLTPPSISPIEKGTKENEDALKRSVPLLSVLLSACDATPDDFKIPSSHLVSSNEFEDQKTPSPNQTEYQHLPNLELVELEDAAFIAGILEKSKAMKKRQHEVLYDIRRVLRKRYSREYDVASFGSSRYGILTQNSDLDLVILDPSMEEGYKPGAIPSHKDLYNTYYLSTWLNDEGFEVLDHIPNAAVPIVKFFHRKTGLYCDINVNERLGLLNTDLLDTYCRVSRLLRPLLLIIKLWAKPRGLNTTASQTKGTVSFSSYALALMTINFLQIRGLLPNLQANLPPLDPKTRGSVYYARSKMKIVECDVRYWSKSSEIQGWKPKDSPSIRMLLADWFTFWARKFHYDADIVSIRHGQVLDGTNIPKQKMIEAIRVMDPFIVDKNVAQTVTPEVIERFRSECESAAGSVRHGLPFHKLTEVCKDLSTV